MPALRSFAPLSLLALGAVAEGVWTTPHDSYSSSVGVLGCKINTDRVAYWPGSISCDNICIKLSYGGRSVNLLRIDQSGGAYDISYDAWNYLQTGKSAATDPIAGGPVAMEYEEVDASECADLIYTPGSKLPLSASNSINYLASCLAQPSSWVAQNHVLYNICDAICSLGQDEECELNLDVSNQPSCPHTLGLTVPLTTAPVYNVQYMTGETVVAGTGKVVSSQSKTPAAKEEADSASAPAPATSAAAHTPVSVPTFKAPPLQQQQQQQPTTTGAVFKETDVAPVPPATDKAPAPTTVPTSATGWTTLVSSATLKSAPSVASVAPESIDRVDDDDEVVPGTGKSATNSTATFAAPVPSGSAVSPSGSRPVIVSGASSLGSKGLLASIASTAAFLLLAVA
ncbi:hypothetical protein OQA88_6033 [Cercophora sp. LCS_1]